jgi:hypothetical protein
MVRSQNKKLRKPEKNRKATKKTDAGRRPTSAKGNLSAILTEGYDYLMTVW